MNIQPRYKNISESEKNQFNAYFLEKQGKIENLLQKINGEAALAKLFIELEKFASKAAYKLKIEFEVPGHYIVVSEDDHSITEVVDLALDKFMTRFKKEMHSYEKKSDKEMRRMEE